MKIKLLNEPFIDITGFHRSYKRLFIRIETKKFEYRIGLLPSQKLSKKYNGSIYYFCFNILCQGNIHVSQIRFLWFAIAWRKI